MKNPYASAPLLRSVLLLVLAFCTPACGGSSGGGIADQAFDLGIVSGSELTPFVIAFENPFDEPATLFTPAPSFSLQFDGAALPTGPIAGRARVELAAFFRPSSSGELLEELVLGFRVGAAEQIVQRTIRVDVDQVIVQLLEARLDFGNVPLGTTPVRTTTLINESRVSDVTYTHASVPNSSVAVTSMLPLVVPAGQSAQIQIEVRTDITFPAASGEVILHSSVGQGDARIGVVASLTHGVQVIELGEILFTDGLSDTLFVDIPSAAYALTFEAWRPDTRQATGPALQDPATCDCMTIERLIGPSGQNYNAPWFGAPSGFAATIPHTDVPTHQLQPGGGPYQVQFRLDNVANPMPVAFARVLVQASPDGIAPLAGTLDLNLWLSSAIGVSAANAPTHAGLQTLLAEVGAVLAQAGISLGEITYYEFNQRVSGATSDSQFEDIWMALPDTPGEVDDRLNVFLTRHVVPDLSLGFAGSIGGTSRGHTLASWVFAAYPLPESALIVAHEILHYLGIWHIEGDPLVSTPASLPGNLMDFGGTQIGVTLPGITEAQGVVARNHPHVR